MNYGSGVYGWWIHRFVRFFFAFLMVLSLSGVTPAAAHTTNPVQSATENTDLPTAHELRLQSETDVKQSAIEQPDTTILCTDDQQTEGSDQCSTVPLNRLGIDRLWYYTTNEHGGGNTSRVNVSNGNLVFQHFGGSISALGFDVLLLHTYNSQATRNTTPESSEDPYASIQRSSSFYGNVWSFIHDIRLFELDEGNTVVLRDGTGTTHRIFTKEADENNIRTYARPLFNGANLTKDLSEQPVDPERVYVLTNDIGATEYFFDADGKLTRMEDLNENYLDFSYDQDRLVHIVDQANRSTILEYTRNRLTKIIDMAGRISTYAYDQRGNLITIKHAVGTADEVTTQLRYNRGNLLGKITNPRGLSSYIAYGRRGEVRTITDATPEHNPILGFRYIKRNQETVVARPDDEGKFQTARYTFNDAGQITEITDPFGATTRVAYDSLLRQSSVTPAGSSAGYQYTYFGETSLIELARNEAGEQTRRGSDLLTGGQRYIIDSRNEARQEAGKSFVATVYYRDDRGNITTIEVNRYAPETDLDQEPLPEPQENLRSIGYTYSSGGLVTSMIDPKGNQTHFTYQDGTGYLTTVTTPAGAGEMSDRVTLVKPNVEGSPTQMIDPKGQKRTFKYDGLGRTKHIAFKGEDGLKAFSHTYAFDPNGNISAIQDSSGSTKWNYDEDDQIIRESRAQNNITQTTHYDYFTKGLLESITTFDNELIHFRYDNKLRVESQTDPKDGGRAITYEYDERGRRTAITFPSGTAQKILYDNANRIDLMTLEQQDGTKLQSFDYDYSVRNNEDFRGGNVLRITELDGSTINYGYDDLDRLIAATRTGTLPFNQKYTYDDNNNRTSMTLDGEVLTAEYDAANQMVEFADTNYRYDRNGNLLSYGENNLNYDQANRWVNGIINGIDVSFEYDGLGRRSSKTVDTERTDYWYNITGLTQETGATEATYLRDLSGALRSVSSDGAVYNYGKDRIGSVRALVDSDGALATDYTYDPWGNLLGDVSDMPNSYRYTSTYSDEATNLYQMGARYYQATSGRFTQADP